MNSIWSGAIALMAYWSSPPRRKSSRRTFTSNPGGPHQDSMPSFVVQSSHTSSMAALNVRSMLTLRRAGWVCGAKLNTAPVGALQRSDVELAHLQQRFHHFCRVPGFGVTHHLPQRRGDNLPGNAEPIFEPAARSFLSAALSQPLPNLIELVLRLTGGDEGERFGERKRRAAIEGRVLLSVEFETGVQQAPFWERTVRVSAQHAADPGVRKHRDVEIDRLFGALLERQARSDTLHLRLVGNGRRLRIRLRHFSSSLFVAWVLPRRSSSAVNRSSRASHIPRYPIIHSSNSRNGSGRSAERLRRAPRRAPHKWGI